MESYLFGIAVILLVILIFCTFWTARSERSRVNNFATRPQSQPNSSDKPHNSEGIFPTTPASQPIEPEDEIAIQDESETATEKTIEIKLPRDANEPETTTTQQPVEEQPAPQTAEQPPKVTTLPLYLLAGQGLTFSGEQLSTLFRSMGLTFGEYQIFHRHLDNLATAPALYSVANFNQQQTAQFESGQLQGIQTNGLYFFMQLPSVIEPVEQFEQMWKDVQQLAKQLQGFVFDFNGRVFDNQSYTDYLNLLQHAHH